MRGTQFLCWLGSMLPLAVLANDTPTISIHIGGNTSFFWDRDPISYIVVASDTEDGDSLSGALNPYSVAVEFQYLAADYDSFNPAPAEAAAIVGATRGKELVEASDCFLCHSERATGPTAIPTYAAIAEKFQGNLSVAPALAYNVINGSQGIWGNMLMPAHDIAIEEATAMAQYVLTFFGAGPARTFRPISGSVTPNVAMAATRGLFGPELAGRYVLTASYMDRGDAGEPPATGFARHAFRYPNVPATELDALEGFETAEADGSYVLAASSGAASARLASIDLTGVRNMTIATLGSARQWSGATIELRLDTPAGDLAGSFEISHASRELEVGRAAVRLDPIDGRRDLYFVVGADQSVAIGAICFECSY